MDGARYNAIKYLLEPRKQGILEAVRKHERINISKMWARELEERQRIMESTSVPQTPLEKKRALRPVIKDHHHQDSLFGNSFQAKSFFVVHPEWLSETVDNTDPEPLHRPPWPWEQPRYRQNLQTPITYKVDEAEAEEEVKCGEEEDGAKTTPPPLPYQLPQMYTFTQPSIDQTRPFDKQTQFGAPTVDTSQYKLSF